jgi:hypothetical protein
MVHPHNGHLLGHEAIDAACRLLDEDQGALRQRLIKAAHLFWQAFYHKDAWPQVIQSEAAGLIAVLFRNGPINMTISQMNDEDLAHTLHVMIGFCRRFLSWHDQMRDQG